MYRRPTQIGTLTVPAGMSKTKDNYECAAWWTEVRLCPGTVPLVATFYDWNAAAGCHAAMVSATFPGHIEDEYMPAMFGGVANPGGPRNDPNRIGQPFELHLSTYAFSAGAGLISGELWGCEAEILPGVKVESFEVVMEGHTSGSKHMPIVVPECRFTSYRVFVGPEMALFLTDEQRAHLAHLATGAGEGAELRPWILEQLAKLGLIRSRRFGSDYYCTEAGVAYARANGLIAPTAG